MTIEEILYIEKDGVINTINDYTRENFIRNYTELLKNINYPKDKDKLLMITYRLVEWYEDNYNQIINNEYIKNKHEHKKSRELLKSLLAQILNE